MNRHGNPRRLEMWEQRMWLERLLPRFVVLESDRRLDAFGIVQPTPAHGVYSVGVRYSWGMEPRVGVLEPPLRPRRARERIPHTFGPDEPCLYVPGTRQWDASMLLATTIIPWLNEWLWFYESWRVTGCWQGGGADHNADGTPVLSVAPGFYF